MDVLTVDNRTYSIDRVPDEIDEIYFCILDMSNADYIDYDFIPLVFLESFYAPAVVLQIGPHTIKMPLDWSILVCDAEMNDVEVLPLTSLNDRGFHALMYNPLADFTPKSAEVEIINVYADVKWFFPRLKNGCMLPSPLMNTPQPPCSMFVKELNKLPKFLEVGDIF